jgi:hypothetical protein
MPWEFENLTVVEYYFKCLAYNRMMEDKWEHTRFVVAAIYNTIPRKDKKTIKPTDVVKLPKDELYRKQEIAKAKAEIEERKKRYGGN